MMTFILIPLIKFQNIIKLIITHFAVGLTDKIPRECHLLIIGTFYG